MKLKSLGKGVSISDKGIYYINYKDETGVSRRRKVVSKTVTEARRELARIRGDVSDIRDGTKLPKRLKDTTSTIATLDELADRYFELMSDKSKARYTNWISGQLGGMELPISPISILEFQNWLSVQTVVKGEATAKLAPATVNLVMSLLKAIVNWGVRHKVVDGDYVVVKRLEVSNDREKVLSKEDVSALFERLESDRKHPNKQTGYGDTALRNMVICSLGLFTGARPTSYIELRRRDIEVDEDGYPLFISYSAKKGGDSFSVPVHTRLRDILGLWLMKEVGSDMDSRLFKVSYNSIKRSVRVIFDSLFNGGLDAYDTKSRVSLYTLRHTYATNVLSATGNIYAVSKLLGHKQIETTKRYAKLSGESMSEIVQSVEF